MAERLSVYVPEYRQEYEKIAQQCRGLSVELLDQCNETSEIDRILREPGSTSKYFRNIDDMTYPRLRLAIEHNHKEFVGHIYSQQILSQVWYGNVSWQGHSTLCKFFHIFMLGRHP